MKILALGLSLAVLTAVSAGAAPAKPHQAAASAHSVTIGKPPLPDFEFKNLRAGQPISEDGFKTCNDSQDGSRECSFAQTDLAGVQSIYPTVGGWFKATTFGGKLSTIEFIADSDNFAILLSALTTRYGSPCKSETPKWQSKAGAIFDNMVVTWCFRTGRLALTQMDFQRDYLSVRYHDEENVPHPVKPKIDF